MSKYTVGQVIEISEYPFVRAKYDQIEFCNDGIVTTKIHGWNPGCDQETDEYGTDFIADGLGKMVLTVVSTHKPGRFPERVFFTREWLDPDGKLFGKSTTLRILDVASFTRLTRGYRHQFELSE